MISSDTHRSDVWLRGCAFRAPCDTYYVIKSIPHISGLSHRSVRCKSRTKTLNSFLARGSGLSYMSALSHTSAIKKLVIKDYITSYTPSFR